MPTYEYKCDKCGHGMDVFQSMKDSPLTKCPVCKSNKLHRIIGTGAGIIFKGSGFYCTDYRSESYKKAVEKDRNEPSKSETAPKDKDKKSTAKAEA